MDNNNKKRYNPKSNAPAVYIPCWLIQIPISLLSHGAKITYGRLSQWADALGHAYRSSKNLAQELGTSEKSIEKYLKELRDNQLIGTYHPQAGGINHFEFYDHPWMHEPIKEQLVYKNDRYDPPSNRGEPSLQSEGPPPSNRRDINIKEIKIKKDIYIGDSPTSNTPKAKVSLSNYSEDERFMSFYSEYPKKEKPRDAYKAFKQIVGDDDALLSKIIDDLQKRKKQHSKWAEKQFISYPATYLRSHEFEGEIFNQQEEDVKIKAEKELANKKREEEQERVSKQNAEYERNKYQQYNQDGKIFREIKKLTPSPRIQPPQEFKDLMDSLKKAKRNG